MNRVRINISKLYREKILQNFTSFSFAQMRTMVEFEDRKYQNIACDRLQENAFSKIKVPSQSHGAIRLKNEKCFPNE